MNDAIVLVFVHGWSITNTDTYGGLPQRLKSEAANIGLSIKIKDIFLGRYISFHDEVKVSDISRAFNAAINDELSDLINRNIRFACITHSTGGPVVRDWWFRYYQSSKNKVCPMSHLIMLAPANYGSALAQLGKGRLSRMKFWLGGVEPGQSILDWLELGSEQSWHLNEHWIKSNKHSIGPKGVFPFVLAGESIDHSVYDHLNTYTGEMGSDGVVRVAAANLQGQHIKLIQQQPTYNKQKKRWQAPKLELNSFSRAPETAFKIVSGKSHSGKKMGIMRSIKENTKDHKSLETVNSIIDCIKIETKKQYDQLSQKFYTENTQVQSSEKLEVVQHLLVKDSYFFHDRYSMIIFRIKDHEGNPVIDFDLVLTAGKDSNPSHLPRGFFVDKQRNIKNQETITYYFNHDVMKGSSPIKNNKGEILREAYIGIKSLGLKIIPRPDEGFVRYLECEIKATNQLLDKVLKANSTTMIDICLQRVVNKNVMRLDSGVARRSFKNTKPNSEIIGD
jgi:hypothetical protein